MTTMNKVIATTRQEAYKTIITANNNSLIADEPIDAGGQNLGFSPFELLASALAACTSITLKMYANRKNWAIETIEVEVTVERNTQTNSTTFQRNIQLSGVINDEQKTRLLSIANACPIHKTLSNEIITNTALSVLG